MRAILLQTFQTVFADSFSKKPYFINPELSLYIFRDRNIFFTGSLFADFTVEMKMPVFVGMFIASIVAELVFCCCIFLNAVNNSFFFKCFQSAVNGCPVCIFKMIFNFRQRKGGFLRTQKIIYQNPHACRFGILIH